MPSGRLSPSLPPQQRLLRTDHIQDPVEGNLSLPITQEERSLSKPGNVRDADDHLIVHRAPMNVCELELRRITSTTHNPREDRLQRMLPHKRTKQLSGRWAFRAGSNNKAKSPPQHRTRDSKPENK